MPLARGLVLYGHLHVRRHARLNTHTGALDVVCASAAALDHPSARVRAGYNVYELEDDGRISAIEARVLQSDARTFERMELALERGNA
jgi:hypothetical protein